MNINFASFLLFRSTAQLQSSIANSQIKSKTPKSLLDFPASTPPLSLSPSLDNPEVESSEKETFAYEKFSEGIRLMEVPFLFLLPLSLLLPFPPSFSCSSVLSVLLSFLMILPSQRVTFSPQLEESPPLALLAWFLSFVYFPKKELFSVKSPTLTPKWRNSGGSSNSLFENPKLLKEKERSNSMTTDLPATVTNSRDSPLNADYNSVKQFESLQTIKTLLRNGVRNPGTSLASIVHHPLIFLLCFSFSFFFTFFSLLSGILT